MNSDGLLPLDEHNDAHILKILNTYHWRKDAAKALGRSVRTLSRWIERRKVEFDPDTRKYYFAKSAPAASNASAATPPPSTETPPAASENGQTGTTFHFPNFDNTASTQPRRKSPPNDPPPA
jgi:hypothetical protein